MAGWVSLLRLSLMQRPARATSNRFTGLPRTSPVATSPIRLPPSWLPGPGVLARELKVRFRAPVRPGDDVDIEVEVIELVPKIRKAVMEGRARVGGNVVLHITADTLLEA
jgi:acyl dehydratase